MKPLLPFSSCRQTSVSLRGKHWAFTLLELLVSVVLIMIVSLVSYSIINSISMAWRSHKARVSAFEGARVGFDLLTHRLSQSTLNTYWDYNDPENPTRYLRMSELHFIMGRGSDLIPSGLSNLVGDAVFFVSPLGFTSDSDLRPLSKMLTASGFFVRFSGEIDRPTFLDSRIPERFRFRLFQFLQSGEALRVYEDATGNNWFASAVATNAFPMVDNVIGLILRANYPTSGGEKAVYDYNSRNDEGNALKPGPQFHQLPPSISVTMVVIDDDSARRLADKFGTSPPPILPTPETRFTDPDQYEADLEAWEVELKSFQPRVAYRIFTANIPIRGAKWSSD